MIQNCDSTPRQKFLLLYCCMLDLGSIAFHVQSWTSISYQIKQKVVWMMTISEKSMFPFEIIWRMLNKSSTAKNEMNEIGFNDKIRNEQQNFFRLVYFFILIAFSVTFSQLNWSENEKHSPYSEKKYQQFELSFVMFCFGFITMDDAIMQLAFLFWINFAYA